MSRTRQRARVWVAPVFYGELVRIRDALLETVLAEPVPFRNLNDCIVVEMSRNTSMREEQEGASAGDAHQHRRYAFFTKHDEGKCVMSARSAGLPSGLRQSLKECGTDSQNEIERGRKFETQVAAMT